MSAAVTLDEDAELEHLLADKAARDQAKAEGARKARIEELRLEARFEQELGPRGQQFEIVDATDHGEGFIVVKLGPGALWRAYRDKLKADKETAADEHSFVKPQIAYPEAEVWKAIFNRREAIRTRCANALATLHGVKVNADRGKF